MRKSKYVKNPSKVEAELDKLRRKQQKEGAKLEQKKETLHTVKKKP